MEGRGSQRTLAAKVLTQEAVRNYVHFSDGVMLHAARPA